MASYPNEKNKRDNVDCNGCGVCMLSCPVWRQSGTQALTVCGRARAEAAGASEEELAESAKACILCGSCAPICPRGVDTQWITISLRQRLVKSGLLPELAGAEPAATSEKKTSGRIFFPGAALRARKDLLDRCLRLFDTDVSVTDEGSDILLDLESGKLAGGNKIEAFLEPLRKAREIIASDGLLVNLLRFLLGSNPQVASLGQALLANDRVRSGLKSRDFYMIETRAYNARQTELVMLYESLRRKTGCFMNLDLQRVATPTGSQSYQHRHDLPGVVNVEAQVRWLLEGRSAERIVVEHLDDAAAFEQYASLPVVHLAEVAEP